MKRTFRLFLAFALLVGAVGCGPTERQVSENNDTPSSDRDRNRGVMGDIGVGMVSSLAMNAIGMGLAAIPGMPKEISALFGGGGDNSEAILAAIDKLSKQIEALDQKVEEVKVIVQGIDSKVQDIAGAVQSLAESDCDGQKFQRQSELSPLVDVVNKSSNDLFGQFGIARGILTNLDKPGTQFDTVSLDSSVQSALQTSYTALTNSQIFYTAFETMSRTLLGDPTSGPGLLSHMMRCSALRKRFLTTNDTAVWKAYADSMVILGVKVLQLKAFVEAFGAYRDKRSVTLLDLNRESLRFEQLARGILFMVQNQIPAGQVLDTKSNKMWTIGTSATMAVNALNFCLSRYSGLNNVAPTPGASLNPTASTSLKYCVTNQKLDNDGEQGQWRIPQVYELARPTGQNGLSLASWMPANLVGLIDGWSGTFCKSTTSAKIQCSTPAQYLASSGAESLASIVNDGLGYVWTNTSLAAARGPRDRDNNPIMRENDAALTNPSGFKNLTSYHYNGGWINGSAFMRAFSRACEEEFNTDPKNSQRYNECQSNFNNDEMGPRCRAIMKGDPMPFSMASIEVVNLGGQVTPMPSNKSAVNSNYMTLVPGGIGNFFGASSYFYQYFACGTYHRDCGWFSCDKWETKDFESLIPQVADLLLVRDLMPGENYVFEDLPTSPIKSWTLRRQFEAPLIHVGSLSSGNVQITIGGSTVGGSLDARCAIDPATVPKKFEEFPASPNGDCNFSLPFRLKPGPHVVYAMAKDLGSSVTSELTKTELVVGGNPPPVVEQVNVTVQPRGIVVSVPAMNADYDYYGEVTAVGENQAPIRCKIDRSSKSCTIGSLVNNKRYSTKVISQFGVLSTPSTPAEYVPFGPPAPPTLSVARRLNTSVELSLAVPQATAIPTPVTAFEVWNGTTKVATCPATDSKATCSVTGLDNAISYDVIAKATNDFGVTPSAAPLTIKSLAPPAAPSGVLVAGSSGTINVAWDRETDGGPASGYVATAYLPSGAAAGACTVDGVTKNSDIVTPPATHCDITKLDGESTYTVKVVGKNDGGESAAATAQNTIRPRFAPGIPVVNASARDGHILLDVQVSSGGSVDSIDVSSNPTGLTCHLVPPVTGCDITAFSRNQTYTFQAVANNKTGPSSPSAASNPIFVYDVPRVPIIKSIETGKSRLTVEMKPSITESVDGWNVADATGSVTCTIVLPATTCDLTGLTNGLAYRVVAAAFNNGGKSAQSVPSASVTPIAEPAPPRQPTVTLGVESATISVAASRDPSITSYVVTETQDAGLTCTITVASPPSPTNSCTVSGLQADFGYSFSVVALNKIGSSLPSERSTTAYPLRPPLAPMDAILTSNLAGITVQVLGDPDSSPAKKYYVNAMPGNLNCIAVGPGGNGQSTCSLNGASRGKNYTISIVGENSGGRSETFTQVFYLIAPPTAPAGLTAEVSPNGIVVGFDSTNMNTDSIGVRVTATPGDVHCDITLPSTTCLLAVDTSRSYELSAVGLSVIGEMSTRVVQQSVTKFISVVQVTTGSDGGQTADETKQTEKNASTTQPTGSVAALSDGTTTAVVPGPEPEQIISGPAPSSSLRSLKISDIISNLKNTSLKNQTVGSTSAKVRATSKKTCSISDGVVTKIKTGECVIDVVVQLKKITKVGKKTTTKTSKVTRTVRLDLK